MPTIYLGETPLGVQHLTGPRGDDENFAATVPEHAVARGKPVPQDVGDELDRRTFEFFFDETFCNPAAEHGRLVAAMRSRSPQPLVIPGLAYAGARYMVTELVVKTQQTDAAGRPTRIEASISLLETPRPGGGSVIATAIATAANAVGNALLRQ